MLHTVYKSKAIQITKQIQSNAKSHFDFITVVLICPIAWSYLLGASVLDRLIRYQKAQTAVIDRFACGYCVLFQLKWLSKSIAIPPPLIP